MNDETLISKDELIQAELTTPLLSSFDRHNHLFSDRARTVERLPIKEPSPANDEALEVDLRCNLTPAQFVEGKLIRNLRGNPMPVRYLLNKAGR
jgi:hypothetical protein